MDGDSEDAAPLSEGPTPRTHRIRLLIQTGNTSRLHQLLYRYLEKGGGGGGVEEKGERVREGQEREQQGQEGEGQE